MFERALNTPLHIPDFNPIQDGLFRGCSRMGGSKKAPLPKIFHTFGAVIIYLKKIQKIYESRDTPLESANIRIFFIRNQKILQYQEIQI